MDTRDERKAVPRRDVEQGPSIEIDRLREGELGVAANLLARCFVDEKVMSYLLRSKGSEVRERLLRPWFRVMLQLFSPFDEIHTARLDGRLAGVGIRVPPGGCPPSVKLKVQGILRMGPVVAWMIIRAPSFRGMFKLIATIVPHPWPEACRSLTFLTTLSGNTSASRGGTCPHYSQPLLRTN